MFEMKKVGRTITVLRKGKGLTQMELADRLGISYQAVSHWERGETMPDIAKLPELASIFEVRIEQILGSEQEAELIGRIVRNPADEPLRQGELTLEQFADIAPLLPQQQADAIFRGAPSPATLEQLMTVAPFVSEQVMDECAEALLGVLTAGELDELLPFMSEEKVDELAWNLYAKTERPASERLAFIEEMFPFMSDAGLARLAERIAVLGSLEELEEILPHVEDETISLVRQRLDERSDLNAERRDEYYETLAEFMDEDSLDALAKQMVFAISANRRG